MPRRKRKTTSRTAPRRAKTRTRTVTQYVTRYRQRRAAKRVSRPRRIDDSLQIGKIVRGSFAAAFGMIVAKVSVNKLTSGGSETELWSWPNIFMAAGSSIVVAFACGTLLKMKKPTVAMIAMGGVGLSFYKAFTTKFAPQWTWTKDWFGADADINPELMGAGEFEVVDYAPAMGAMPGQAMLGATNAGGQTVPFNPAMGATDSGGQLVAYNPNMGAADYAQLSRRTARAYPGSY